MIPVIISTLPLSPHCVYRENNPSKLTLLLLLLLLLLLRHKNWICPLSINVQLSKNSQNLYLA